MQAQGWKEGDYLGAKDASHVKYHTAASLSHVKVSIREENLGLGARVGAAGGEWETTGLGGFQDLLGRLNGKSEVEIERGQSIRNDFKRSMYAERRWGTLRFVSGGFLLGDQIEDRRTQEARQHSKKEEITPSTHKLALSSSASKTQKEDELKKRSKERPESHKGLNASHSQPLERAPSLQDASALRAVPTAQETDKARRRAEKTERKLQRSMKREARRERKIRSTASSAITPTNTHVESTRSEDVKNEVASGQPSNGIQAVRYRSIKQKKLAIMDSKALNEVGFPLSIKLDID